MSVLTFRLSTSSKETAVMGVSHTRALGSGMQATRESWSGAAPSGLSVQPHGVRTGAPALHSVGDVLHGGRLPAPGVEGTQPAPGREATAHTHTSPEHATDPGAESTLCLFSFFNQMSSEKP